MISEKVRRVSLEKMHARLIWVGTVAKTQNQMLQKPIT